MSISNKLNTIAENVSKVYEAGRKAGGDYNSAYNDGYAKGYTEGETAGYSNGYNIGYTDGNYPLTLTSTLRFTNVYNLPQYINIGNERLTDISNMFYQSGGAETIILNILNCTKLGSAFRECANLKKVEVTASDNTTSLGYICMSSSKLEEITLNFSTANVTTWNYAFFGTAIHTINGAIDMSSASSVGAEFRNMSKLVHIRFVANTIKHSISFDSSDELSAESVQSIIDGLADLTGQTAQTITLPSSIVLTDEQKATIASKNRTLVQ